VALVEDVVMRVCEFCGKGTISGNNVSKSMNHKKRVWKPNLLKMKIMDGGTVRSVHICTRCLKTSDKYGILEKKV